MQILAQLGYLNTQAKKKKKNYICCSLHKNCLASLPNKFI